MIAYMIRVTFTLIIPTNENLSRVHYITRLSYTLSKMRDFFALIKHVRYFDECTYTCLSNGIFSLISKCDSLMYRRITLHTLSPILMTHILVRLNYIQFAYRIRVRRISVTSSLLTQLSFNSLIIKLIIYLIN